MDSYSQKRTVITMDTVNDIILKLPIHCNINLEIEDGPRIINGALYYINGENLVKML